MSLLTENYPLTDKSLLHETAFSEMLISLLLHMEIRGKKIYILVFPRVLFVHSFIIFLTLSSHSNKGGFISKGSIQLICNKVLLLKFYFSLQNLAPLHTCSPKTCKHNTQCCSFFLDSAESNQQSYCSIFMCLRCT